MNIDSVIETLETIRTRAAAIEIMAKELITVYRDKDNRLFDLETAIKSHREAMLSPESSGCCEQDVILWSFLNRKEESQP